MKQISSYFGPLGFIYHLDDKGLPEYGDGTSRLGLYWFIVLLGKSKSDILCIPFLTRYKMCFSWPKEPLRYPGHPVRVPGEREWYSKPGVMSRDNMIPCLSTLAMLGRFDGDLLLKILKRGGFLWNTKHIGQQVEGWKIPDWVGLSVLALLIRAWVNGKFTRYLLVLPFLLVADFFLILSTILRLVQLSIDADNCDGCINKIALLAGIKESKTQTPLSWFAHLLYCSLHPGAGPSNQSRKSGYGPLTSFQHYFDGIKNPPIDELWRDYLTKRF